MLIALDFLEHISKPLNLKFKISLPQPTHPSLFYTATLYVLCIVCLQVCVHSTCIHHGARAEGREQLSGPGSLSTVGSRDETQVMGLAEAGGSLRTQGQPDPQS